MTIRFGPRPAAEPQARDPSGYFVGALVDAFAPIVTYFVLHALGASPLVALVLGVLVAVTTTVMHTLRRKRIDGFGVLVIAEIGVAIGLQFLMHDPRLLLVKPSFYSGIAALYLAYTAWGDRPLTYEGARPMATRGDPARLAAYERAWQNSPKFRALHRTATLGWAAAFLADAVLRAVIVYGFPVDRAIWLSNVPHMAAIVLLVGFSALIGRTTKPLVEAQLREPAAENGSQRRDVAPHQHEVAGASGQNQDVP